MLREAVFDLAQSGYTAQRLANAELMTHELRQTQARLAARGIRGGPGIFELREVATKHIRTHCHIAYAEVLRSCDSYGVEANENLVAELTAFFDRLVADEVSALVANLHEPILAHCGTDQSFVQVHTALHVALLQNRMTAVTEFEHYSTRLMTDQTNRRKREQVNAEHAFRLDVLRALSEYSSTTDAKPIFTAQVAERLQVEDTVEQKRRVGNAIKYWHDKGAIDAQAGGAINQEFPYFMVTGVTAHGHDLLEGRIPSAVAGTVYNFTNSMVANAGNVYGNVTQNVDMPYAELANALERLRDAMQASDDPGAVPVEALAEKAATIAREQQPDLSKLMRFLASIPPTIAMLANVPPAWTLVAAEALKIGLQIPGPPTIPSH